MTKTPSMRIRNIYKILLSVSIIIAGICLIAGCLYIYFSGNGYSRPIVADIFAKINIPIYLCLALIIGDIIWEFISPTTVKPKSFKKKIDETSDLPSADKRVKISRFVILGVAIVIIIFGFITGGYVDVLTKAVNICTECIGLG